MMPSMNIVVIMTDSQGSNMVGAYGTAGVRTPRIDRLAREGIRFADASTTCPVCTPARAGIFTGLLPSKTGAWTNNLGLSRDVRSMGAHFRAAGYDTAYIGKWHLDGHDYFGDGTCPPEWDERWWFDGLRYLRTLDESGIARWRHGCPTIADLRRQGVDDDATWAHQSTGRALGFLAEPHQRPFLLVVSYDEPHGPSLCPPEWAEPFADYRHEVGPAAFDDLADKPAHHREYARGHGCRLPDGRLHHPLYFGCNAFVDHQIGRVLDAIDRHAPDTCVVYTSDHGDMMGAHGLGSKGPAMYQGILSVPLILRLPGRARAGEVVATPASHLDILPTLMRLAGLPVPPILDGSDLLALPAADNGRGVLVEFARHSLPHDGYAGFQPIRCLVTGGAKLAINLTGTDELYDRRADPHELRNRVGDPALAGLRDHLHDRLLERMDEVRDPFRGDCWSERPWRQPANRRQRRYRPKPHDGYGPPARIYDTGLPA